MTKKEPNTTTRMTYSYTHTHSVIELSCFNRNNISLLPAGMHISFQSDKTHFSFSICFTSEIDERDTHRKQIPVVIFFLMVITLILTHDKNFFAEFFGHERFLLQCVCVSLIFVIFFIDTNHGLWANKFEY